MVAWKEIKRVGHPPQRLYSSDGAEFVQPKPAMFLEWEQEMQNDQQSVFNTLKAEGPEAWRAYLRPLEEGKPITGLSMLVIYHYAAVLAKKQGSLDWAEVAVRAAELEARNCSGASRENALLWAMQLRSWFIAKMGSGSNHFVLDKDVILSWAMEGLKLSVQSAKEKLSSLAELLALAKKSSRTEDRQRLRDDLIELVRIKHRLNVVKVLADCGELTNESPLYAWLQIRELLP